MNDVVITSIVGLLIIVGFFVISSIVATLPHADEDEGRIVRAKYGHDAAMGYRFRARLIEEPDGWVVYIDRMFMSTWDENSSWTRVARHSNAKRAYDTREEAVEAANRVLDMISAPQQGEII